MSTTRRNKETRTMITVGNAEQDGYCTGGGPWYTLCEDHGNIINHDTKALATSHAAAPSGWCNGCRRCWIHRHLIDDDNIDCTECAERQA
jgi:hypothetical protein